MLVVTGIIAVMLGVAYPSIVSSIDAVRLATAADSVAALLHQALDRAERRQEVIELKVTKARLIASSADARIRELEIPPGIRVDRVEPDDPSAEAGERHLYFYPGGVAPRVAITLTNDKRTVKRRVQLDPITGAPEVER